MLNLMFLCAALRRFFLCMNDLLHLVFDLPELFHFRMDGGKLCLPGLILLFQTVTLPAPCGDGQFAALEIRL